MSGQNPPNSSTIRRNSGFDPDHFRRVTERAKASGMIQAPPPEPESPPKPEEKPIPMGAFVDFDFVTISKVLGLAINRAMTPMRISRAIHRRLEAMTSVEKADIPQVVREMIDGLRCTILGSLPSDPGKPVVPDLCRVSDTSVRITSPRFTDLVMRLERSISWPFFRDQLTWLQIHAGELMLQGAVVQSCGEYDRQRGVPWGSTLSAVLVSMQKFPASMPCVAQELLDAEG